MKKILITALIVFASAMAYAQTDTISNGEDMGSVRGKLNETIIKGNEHDTMLQDSLGTYYPVSYGMSQSGLEAQAGINVIGLQAAVDAAEANGGGIVKIPSGVFYLNGTININSDNVIIKGDGKSTVLRISNVDGYRTAFHFENPTPNQIKDCRISDFFVWLEQDTIVFAKFRRPIFCEVENMSIRNNTALAKNDTAIVMYGTDFWGGGNLISRCNIYQIHVGIDIDSVCNHNMIMNNWIQGNDSKYAGGRGIILGNRGDQNSGTSTIFNNDFEGWRVGIWNDQSETRMDLNRFETLDTAIHETLINGLSHISGTTYAYTTTEYSGSKYGNRFDAGDPIVIGKNSQSLELHSLQTTGSSIKIYNGAVSTSLNLFEVNTYTNTSHTNVFGETVTVVEGIVSSDYNFKLGTSASYDFGIYTNNLKRLNVKSGGISTYADNAAAISGGLVAGDVYRLSDGTLMVTY